MREIVHLQAGQCGNQIGAKPLKRNFFNNEHFSKIQRQRRVERKETVSKSLLELATMQHNQMNFSYKYPRTAMPWVLFKMLSFHISMKTLNVEAFFKQKITIRSKDKQKQEILK
ncbi:CLUMA_CG001087, isoform A [Clunio marinus]|uniref:CLUMA_CG001087, isoform A n=1 Tax=Clunio marinus TaxID=568069 RepID=A0A1J1HH10_9DIPT|nr:CLUMA_CG001087, isoform A [Clunio marinus]